MPGRPKTTSTPCPSSAATSAPAPVRTRGSEATVIPSAPLRGLAGLDQRDEVVDLSRAERLVEGVGHLRRPWAAGRGEGARVNDRLLDERGERHTGLLGVARDLVEVRPDRAGRVGRGQRVAAAAAGGCEDGLAGVRVARAAARAATAAPSAAS